MVEGIGGCTFVPAVVYGAFATVRCRGSDGPAQDIVIDGAVACDRLAQLEGNGLMAQPAEVIVFAKLALPLAVEAELALVDLSAQGIVTV